MQQWLARYMCGLELKREERKFQVIYIPSNRERRTSQLDVALQIGFPCIRAIIQASEASQEANPSMVDSFTQGMI